MKIFLGLFIFLSVSLTYSQSKETVVTFNLDQKDFTTPLPFDEAFKIKFVSSEPIALFRIKYRIALDDIIDEKFREKFYFQKDADAEGFIVKEIKEVSGENFSIGGIGPLHPNTPYEFIFHGLEKVDEDDKLVKALTEDVQKFLYKTYVTSEKIPPSDELESTFNTILQKYVENLYDKEGEPLTVLDIFSEDLKVYRKNLSSAQKNYTLAVDNYTSKGIQTLNTHTNSSFCSLIKHINSKNLNNPEILDEPINLLLENYSNITLNKLIPFYKLDCNRDYVYLESLINGDVKFNKELELKALTNAQQYENVESLMLLRSSFDLMNNIKLKSSKSENFDEVFDSTYNNHWDTLIKYSARISDYRKDILELNSTVPNILQNKYTQNAYKLDYRAVTDVETAATPYINLDLGLLYASNLNDVFALQTVNFHLLPVNRNVLFSELEGKDKFFKRVCFQIGLAQRLGPSEDTYKTFLTGDFGTPYIGFGYRINRILRTSAGMVVYREKNINPVINEDITKRSLAVTLTINSGLSKALGLIGSIFQSIQI